MTQRSSPGSRTGPAIHGSDLWYSIVAGVGKRVLAGLLLALIAAPASLHAQNAPGEIRGVVLGSDSAGVAGAVISLLPGGAMSRSNQQGRFSMRGVAPGRYQLIVRRVGFLPDTSQVDVGASGMLNLLIRLRPPVLERVSVTAVRAGLPNVADRERRGLGAVMYADEIASSSLFGTADLLNFSPRLLIGNRTNVRYSEMLYVDGRPIRDSSDIPDKRDIAAIEAHRGYLGLRDDPDVWIPYDQNPMSSARIVLIWTNQFMQRKQERLSSPQ